MSLYWSFMIKIIRLSLLLVIINITFYDTLEIYQYAISIQQTATPVTSCDTRTGQFLSVQCHPEGPRTASRSGYLLS